MSFSSDSKNEISRKPIEKSCCVIAELSAYVRTTAYISMQNFKDISVEFSTENAAFARRIYSILKKSYDIHSHVEARKVRKLKNAVLYIVKMREKALNLLLDTGLLSSSKNIFDISNNIPFNFLNNSCCKKAYLRGCFLGCGSVTDPEKSYHLEFVNHSEEHAGDMQKLLLNFEINSGIIRRKSNYVVYVKESEKISDFLNIAGAYTSLFKLENIRALKSMRNDVNRIVNCETANLEKVVSAAVKQSADIKKIQEKSGLESLPSDLLELAMLRLAYPEASLKELGEMFSPPITKSGVNYKFKKIEKIAEEL